MYCSNTDSLTWYVMCSEVQQFTKQMVSLAQALATALIICALVCAVRAPAHGLTSVRPISNPGSCIRVQHPASRTKYTQALRPRPSFCVMRPGLTSHTPNAHTAPLAPRLVSHPACAPVLRPASLGQGQICSGYVPGPGRAGPQQGCFETGSQQSRS